MVQITLKPDLARKLISPREKNPVDNEEIKRSDEINRSLEEGIKAGEWDNVPPIWITPNLFLNGIFCGAGIGQWHPTIKPFIVYNGHHRLKKALEHNLPIRAYVRYTPGNPEMPAEEKLYLEDYY